MSLSFYIPNKKLFFSKKILKVQEVLDLIPRLQILPENNSANFDKQKFLESQLNEHDSILVGIDGKSGRGFEISYGKDPKGKDSYIVRFLTPSPIDDWKIGLAFIKILSQKLGTKITSEYEETLTPDTIENYDYRHDIMFGISGMFAPHEDPNTGELVEPNILTLTLFGINRPVVFDRNLKKRLLDAENPVEEFSKFFTDIQYMEAYSAKQKFFRSNVDNSLFGAYMITENIEVILPFKPFVEFANINVINPKEVDSWKLNLIYIDGDDTDPDSYKSLSVVDYNSFMEHLPKDKYEFIDATYIVINELSKKDMENILEKMN